MQPVSHTGEDESPATSSRTSSRTLRRMTHSGLDCYRHTVLLTYRLAILPARGAFNVKQWALTRRVAIGFQSVVAAILLENKQQVTISLYSNLNRAGAYDTGTISSRKPNLFYSMPQRL